MPRPPEAGRPKLRHRVERALVRATLAFARALPSRAGAVLADRLGDAMRLALPGRARLAREQMAAALGRPAGDREVAAWSRAAFRHFLRIPLELIHAPRLIEAGRLAELLVVHGRDHVETARARGHGVILLTGHFGNWELFSLASGLVGLDVLGVARPLKNLLLDEDLMKLRGRYGMRLVGKDGAALPLARQLKSGGAIGLLNDQHAGSRGLRVPFFHADASTFTLAPALARRFGAPIVPWFARVAGLHRIEVRFDAPIAPDPSLSDDEDAYRMLRLFHDRLEAAIRADPGQYLWFHRRWKQGGQEPDPRWRERYAPRPS